MGNLALASHASPEYVYPRLQTKKSEMVLLLPTPKVETQAPAQPKPWNQKSPSDPNHDFVLLGVLRQEKAPVKSAVHTGVEHAMLHAVSHAMNENSIRATGSIGAYGGAVGAISAGKLAVVSFQNAYRARSQGEKGAYAAYMWAGAIDTATALAYASSAVLGKKVPLTCNAGIAVGVGAASLAMLGAYLEHN